MADNLLDKASILLTPTAYNDGSMLSVKPENGDGDFTFSRSSAATRVNAQGLVENVQIISSELVSNGNFSQIGTEEVSNGNFSQEGSELITNGDFATDSDWTKQTSWSISGGSANYDFLSDAKYIRQTLLNGGFVSGKTYKINFEITSGTAYMNINSNGGGLVSLNTYSVGSYSLYTTASVNGSDLLIYGRNTSGTAFSIDNVSVKEVGQDWTLGTGWSIGDDKVEADGTSAFLIQSGFQSVASVKSYKIQYEVISTNGVNIRFGGGSSMFGTPTLDTSTIGIKTIYLTSNGTVRNLQFQNNLGFIGSITNISVKEVGQDWTPNANATLSIDNGRLKVAVSDGSGYPSQNITTVVGKKYKITADAFIGTATKVSLYSAAFGFNDLTADGSYNLTFTATSTSTQIRLYVYEDGTYGFWDNISVKEITDDTDLPRINYEGFSYQDTLGSEIIPGGDFETDTGWNGQKTIANGQLTKNSSGLVYKSILDVSVKDYKVVVDVDTKGSALTIYLGGAQQSLSVGVNTIDMQSGGSNAFVGFNNGDGSVINSISVKEVLGQEVVPDSGCGSWLLEGQSTNLITESESFSSWNKDASVSITSTDKSSPLGTNNASEITVTDSGRLYHDPTISTTADRVTSIFIKGGTFVNFKFTCIVSSEIDLNAETATNNFGIQKLTNGWFRISTTAQSVTSTSRRIQLQAYPDNTYTNGHGQTGTYSIIGTQMENTLLTSYIPTNGATNTRLQDIANNSGNSTLINSTEGVLYAEATYENFGVASIISLTDGTNTNRVMIYWNTNDTIILFIRVNSVYVAEYTIPANQVDVSIFNKIAIKYKTNDMSFWLNGTKVATDTSGTMFSANTLTKLAFNSGSGGAFYGKVKALAVFKEALTDAQLQSLTTI